MERDGKELLKRLTNVHTTFDRHRLSEQPDSDTWHPASSTTIPCNQSDNSPRRARMLSKCGASGTRRSQRSSRLASDMPEPGFVRTSNFRLQTSDFEARSNHALCVAVLHFVRLQLQTSETGIRARVARACAGLHTGLARFDLRFLSAAVNTAPGCNFAVEQKICNRA